MITAASDESPVPVDKPRLFKLAIAGLLLSAVVQTACLAVIRQQFAPPGTTFAGIDSTYFVTSALVIWICAQSSAIVPAVLAAGHVAFRAVLIGLSVLTTWAILVADDYMKHSYLPPDAMATHATVAFMIVAGIPAGLIAGVMSHATLFGWVLARDTENAARPTFSLRGMLIATAVTAVLFTSPRFMPLILELLMTWAYSILGHESTTGVTAVRSVDDGVTLGMAGMAGVLLTINLSAAVWCLRSRQGYQILIALSLAFGLLGVLADMRFGGGNAGLGMGVALAVSLFAGSLLTTAQTAIWERFGWQLVRVRRDSTSPAGQAVGSRQNDHESDSRGKCEQHPYD